MSRRVAVRLFAATAVLIACAAIAGCQSKPAEPTGLAPDQVATAEVARGVMPGFEIVDPSTLPTRTARTLRYWGDGGSRSDNRPTLEKGQYVPIIAGKNVTLAELTTDELDGIAKPVLIATFDPAATKTFANFTNVNSGKQYVVIVNGVVLAVHSVDMPVTDGKLQIPVPADQVSAVKAAITAP
jgi:preprotein translocase subunit SecD